MIQHVKQEIQGADYLILWLDNDKEGESICFEVIDIAMEHLSPSAQIYRAKFSSVTPKDILEAFKNLSVGPNLNEAMSVDARQIIDLKVGVAFSRFQTMHFRRRLGLQQKLITFGPCQTPALGFCVARHDEIVNFEPRPFWRIVPMIESKGESIPIEWSSHRTLSLEEAKAVKASLEEAKQLKVVSVVSRDAVKTRPEALNTVHLLKVASSQLGIGPNDAMHLAEKLYLAGLITYPRTESTSYGDNFDFGSVIKGIASNGLLPWSEYAHCLLVNGINEAKSGKNAGDHPPITPTLSTPRPGQLQQNEMRIYEYVSRHFLGSLSQNAKFKKTQVLFSLGKNHQTFELKGSSVLQIGFMEIMPWFASRDKLIPEFQKDQIVNFSTVEIVEGATTPPEHLSESDLVGLMEQNGIGTDASMATHIHNICQRNYVEVQTKSRRLVPTQLGISLAHGYMELDEELVSSELRSSIEQKCEMIAKGEAEFGPILAEVLHIFKMKFQYFTGNIQIMEEFFPRPEHFVNREREKPAFNFLNFGRGQGARRRFQMKRQFKRSEGVPTATQGFFGDQRDDVSCQRPFRKFARPVNGAGFRKGSQFVKSFSKIMITSLFRFSNRMKPKKSQTKNTPHSKMTS